MTEPGPSLQEASLDDIANELIDRGCNFGLVLAKQHNGTRPENLGQVMAPSMPTPGAVEGYLADSQLPPNPLWPLWGAAQLFLEQYEGCCSFFGAPLGDLTTNSRINVKLKRMHQAAESLFGSAPEPFLPAPHNTH